MKRGLIAFAATLGIAFAGAASAQQDKAGGKSANADAKQLRQLAIANMAEIEAGKLALEKAPDPT